MKARRGANQDPHDTRLPTRTDPGQKPPISPLPIRNCCVPRGSSSSSSSPWPSAGGDSLGIGFSSRVPEGFQQAVTVSHPPNLQENRGSLWLTTHRTRHWAFPRVRPRALVQDPERQYSGFLLSFPLFLGQDCLQENPLPLSEASRCGVRKRAPCEVADAPGEPPGC